MIFGRRAGRHAPEGNASSARWIRLAALSDVRDDRALAVANEHGEFVLAREDDAVYALEDRCTHQAFPLSGGDVEDGEIECPFHGARFELCSGRALGPPAFTPVRTFEVEVRDGSVYVRLD